MVGIKLLIRRLPTAKLGDADDVFCACHVELPLIVLAMEL